MVQAPTNAGGQPATPETPYNAGEHDSVKRLRERAKLRQQNHELVLEMIMKDRRGRAWLFDLLAEFGLNRNPYAQNALAMSFACGELNAAQKLQARAVSTFPDFYVQMLTEGAEDGRE